VKVRQRNWSGAFFAALLAAPVVLLAGLMLKTQTSIDPPEPGQDIPLSALSYKARAFEAKLSSVRLDWKSQADPLVGEWTFLGSNTDGQMHRLEAQLRLQDESGKQLDVFSQHCALSPGSHDQPCKVAMKVKAGNWKATRTVRIVADWVN
jgi:hypothetical protein